MKEHSLTVQTVEYDIKILLDTKEGLNRRLECWVSVGTIIEQDCECIGAGNHDFNTTVIH